MKDPKFRTQGWLKDLKLRTQGWLKDSKFRTQDWKTQRYWEIMKWPPHPTEGSFSHEWTTYLRADTLIKRLIFISLLFSNKRKFLPMGCRIAVNLTAMMYLWPTVKLYPVCPPYWIFFKECQIETLCSTVLKINQSKNPIPTYSPCLSVRHNYCIYLFGGKTMLFYPPRNHGVSIGLSCCIDFLK